MQVIYLGIFRHKVPPLLTTVYLKFATATGVLSSIFLQVSFSQPQTFPVTPARGDQCKHMHINTATRKGVLAYQLLHSGVCLHIDLSVMRLKLLLQPAAEAMTWQHSQMLTIKIVVVKGDAVGGWALVHPKVHVLALPFMVSVEMPQGSVGLILAQLASLIKLAIFHHFTHLHNMYCQQHTYHCLQLLACIGSLSTVCPVTSWQVKSWNL